MKTAVAAALALTLTLLAACSQKARSEATGERPPVAVETARVAEGSLDVTVEAVGTLQAKYSADVKTEYSGIVTQVLVTEWVPVRKGQVLARLDTREARAALLQVQAEAARADREYERALKLHEAGLMTAQGLEDSRTLRDTAAAQLEMARTRLEKAEIRSPMEGVVSHRGVSPGDYVENMGAPAMFRVVDNRLFDLTVSVPSSRVHLIQAGQVLRFTSDAVPGRVFEGRVAFINPSADEASRTVKVRVEVPNPDGALKSGLFVKGTILCGSRSGLLLVPREALLTWDVATGAAEVFTVEEGRARRKAVRAGEASGGSVVVAEGLKAGDEVVVRGAFNVQDGDRVAVAP
ncbi:MAG: efflux RND transporter periplasmic adaptor subunit [Acidobacteriota bacterium]